MPKRKLRGTIKARSLHHVSRKKGIRGCIITVENPDDQLCLYRAVAIAKAHKEFEEAKDKKKGKSILDSLYKTYKSLRNKWSRGRKNPQRERAAKALRHAVHGAAPASFDDVVKLAHHLRRNIIVLNLDMQDAKPRYVQFQTRDIHDYGWKTTLLVYLEVRLGVVSYHA